MSVLSATRPLALLWHLYDAEAVLYQIGIQRKYVTTVRSFGQGAGSAWATLLARIQLH